MLKHRLCAVFARSRSIFSLIFRLTSSQRFFYFDFICFELKKSLLQKKQCSRFGITDKKMLFKVAVAVIFLSICDEYLVLYKFIIFVQLNAAVK